MTDKRASGDIDELLAIMAKLRDPNGGCPWDLAQNFKTIAPYTIEEAYELASAIETGDMAGLKDELGDLLLQVVFHARMAEEAGEFRFADVVRAISEKMLRRHPHVFGDADASTPTEVSQNWEEIKRAERAAKGEKGLLGDVPIALPALLRAIKLQNRAAQVGFDWPSAITVADKIAEEARELAEAADAAKSGTAKANVGSAKIAEEFGDLLFAMANLARHLKLDAETALRDANAKFVRRFRSIERGLEARGKRPQDASLDEMEALWQEAKKDER